MIFISSLCRRRTGVMHMVLSGTDDGRGHVGLREHRGHSGRWCYWVWVENNCKFPVVPRFFYHPAFVC